MATEVIMPALGMAQETGKVLRWLKAEGDAVTKGEPVMEVETDKVTVEIEAPADGTLAVLTAAEGDDVPVGRPVAVVLAAGESAAELPAAAAPGPVPAPAVAAVSPAPAGNRDAGAGRGPLASPKARRLAGERGIDIDSLAGSGPHGAVVAADLERASAAAGSPRVGRVWLRMAEHTAASWRDVPHFFLLRDIDAGRLQAWRRAVRGRPGHEAVTHTDLLVKLCAAALLEHPRVNGTWRDGEIVTQEEVNIGIAVATDDGLVVPVVHRADSLELGEIAARRATLVEAARSGKLRPEDVQGGTFTISNLGMYGIDAFLAILNAPQAAILAVGRIADRIVAVDGAPAVRPGMTLSLSCDHRVVDGALGARFLDTLAGFAEEPAVLVS